MVNRQSTSQQTPAQKQASIDRAVTKAFEQARVGNTPMLIRTLTSPLATDQVYGVASRMTGGLVYVVDLTADVDGLHTRCCCEASHAGRICWHRAACRLAALGEIGHYEPGDTAPAALAPDPSEPADWCNYGGMAAD